MHGHGLTYENFYILERQIKHNKLLKEKVCNFKVLQRYT